MPITIRKPYDQSIPVRSTPVGKSMTKQSFAGETDINTIMKRYQKTGVLDHVAKHKGDYSDLVPAGDYHDHMNTIIAADEAFASLPSSIRRQFDNDPSQFLEFVDNPANQQEMVDLGLLEHSQMTTEGASASPETPPVETPSETPSTPVDTSGAG